MKFSLIAMSLALVLGFRLLTAAEPTTPLKLPTQVLGMDWAEIATVQDLPALVVRLRASGFPEPIVSEIITARVHDRYADRLAALPREEREFWQTSEAMDKTQLAKDNARYALLQERADTITALLDPQRQRERDPQTENMERREYGHLSREKVRRAQTIVAAFSAERSALRAANHGITLPTDRFKFADIEARERAELATVLTPDELEERLMRVSPAAETVRSELRLLSPTKEEFREVFRLRDAYELRFGIHGNAPAGVYDSAAQRQAADKVVAEKIKKILGQERGEEYERLRDNSYRSAVLIARRLELPKERALKVWNLRKEAQVQRLLIRERPDRSTEQRQEELNALAAKLGAQVTDLLTERGHRAYLNSGGSWLKAVAMAFPGPR